MANLCVVTVTAPAAPFDKQFQELEYIARALALASQAMRAAGGQVTSGNIATDGAAVIGNFVYTPVAAS